MDDVQPFIPLPRNLGARGIQTVFGLLRLGFTPQSLICICVIALSVPLSSGVIRKSHSRGIGRRTAFRPSTSLFVCGAPRSAVRWSKVWCFFFPRPPGGLLISAWLGLASTAIIEYSLDLDLPDDVFENPIIKSMSDATNDLMTWPNVGVHCPL